MRFFGEKLKKLVRSRFFIIAASVAVFLTVLPVTLASMGRTDLLRSAANLLATPFKSAAVYCGNAIDGFADYFTEFDRLKKENEELRQQLADALEKNEQAEIAISENEWLREFLLFENGAQEHLLIDARTVGRESGDFVTTFTLNKGTKDGIEVGMPVITDTGLVGYIAEAGFNYSKVKTVICNDVNAGAICARSGAYGHLEGNFGYSEDSLCKLVLQDGSADVSVGDVIFTSGVGSVYPYGLRIGTVSRVELDEYDRTLTAYIDTSVDFSEIYRVIVLAKAERGESGE